MRVIILPFVFRQLSFTKKAGLTIYFLEGSYPCHGHYPIVSSLCNPPILGPRAATLSFEQHVSVICVIEVRLFVKVARKLRITSTVIGETFLRPTPGSFYGCSYTSLMLTFDVFVAL